MLFVSLVKCSLLILTWFTRIHMIRGQISEYISYVIMYAKITNKQVSNLFYSMNWSWNTIPMFDARFQEFSKQPSDFVEEYVLDLSKKKSRSLPKSRSVYSLNIYVKV